METLWNCLIAGLGGTFCIGLIVALAAKNEKPDPYLLLFLKVGICGGFTTFSAFSLETAGLLQTGSYFLAVLYMALSVILCVAAVIGTKMLVKLFI